MSRTKRHKTPNRKPVPPSAYGKRKHHPTLKKLIAFPDGRQEHHTYRIKPLRIDLKQCLTAAAGGDPDFAVVLVPAALTVDWMRTHPANACAQACIHLVDVYRLLGVEAHIVPVTVAIKEGLNLACYGEDPPTWDDTVFVGHCIVHLPGVGRFVDPTVQQFDGFQHLKYPYLGKTVFSSQDRRHYITGDQLRLMVDNRPVIYTVAEADESLIDDHPAAQHVRDKNERAAANIASQAIHTFRALGLADRIPDHHHRIRAMLDTVGEAELRVETGAARFIIDGQPRWGDELLPT